jgi:predicted tellurium resistance membrane protein TerC
MAFDSISTIMFTLVFLVGFVFSILGITDFCYAVEKKKTPWLGLIGSVIAAVVWMSFSLIWVAGSTMELFVSYGYLWMGLMLIFFMFAVASIALILRNSVKPDEEPALQIKERM